MGCYVNFFLQLRLLHCKLQEKLLRVTWPFGPDMTNVPAEMLLASNIQLCSAIFTAAHSFKTIFPSKSHNINLITKFSTG